jgi:hypothetical protein
MRYNSDEERERHLRTARHLAREIAVSEARVIEAYERELERLIGLARVRQFLAVLAVKHVKTELGPRGRQSA